ncbi:FAD-dependent oxidoreductase [Sphingobium sp. B11D3D]|uniref:FAD-dependent oxidoreductase n=1 Tax=Sphingobium sp. B11D3D TaxID=2940576 RepID=UPI0022244437|nr:FAD-dependent oxidoreductase [Sphingobium sp. B11D3D]MCW2370573.1 hypothetical protein [Sphingobium sp. B11D3D]
MAEFPQEGQLGVERRAMLTGTIGAAAMLGLQACAPASGSRPATLRAPSRRTALVPIRISRDQLIDVKCCIRPLRAAGPNLDVETVGDALVIHNYGHGGSGWSLSWGSADIAVGKALSVLPREIAVVGCGIIGLTTAVMAQRAGLKVTLYARESIQQTRSFRASGSFTPDSRIALAEPAGPAFGELWERMARFSWKAFRTYLGLPGHPVEFGDSYQLSDTPITRREWPADPAITQSFATSGRPQQNSEFGHYSERIRDIVPQAQPLSAEDNPFPQPHVRRSSQMIFNFASYAHVMLGEFFERGGQFVMRDFARPADYAALPQKVVINCTGYAARDLWQDKTIIPVRGQTGWLVPQPDAFYSVRYRNVSLTSKRDGIVVMNNNPDMGEMLGVGDSMELPNVADIEKGLEIMAPVFAPGFQAQG